jgi:hypothetical protein
MSGVIPILPLNAVIRSRVFIIKYCGSILVTGSNILVYIFIENQQMYQNDNFIVMLSQTLLHVSAYQRHHQGTRMILTSYLYVDVH